MGRIRRDFEGVEIGRQALAPSFGLFLRVLAEADDEQRCFAFERGGQAEFGPREGLAFEVREGGCGQVERQGESERQEDWFHLLSACIRKDATWCWRICYCDGEL